MRSTKGDKGSRGKILWGLIYAFVCSCALARLLTQQDALILQRGRLLAAAAGSVSMKTAMVDPKPSQVGVNSIEASKLRNNIETVWLYSLITTDYGGPNVVPHFIQHYLNLGLQTQNIYVDLLHDPVLPDVGLQQSLEYFRSVEVDARTILQAYAPELQDRAMVTRLATMPMDPEDWVIVADMDELFIFDAVRNITDIVRAMNAEGATFALGEMLDHVAYGGQLRSIGSSTDIWQQFPLICPIVSHVGGGLPVKVTLHKAFLRSGAGHHHIVHPFLAEAYFSSKCKGISCELVMKMYKQRAGTDVFQSTPYPVYSDRYAQSADSTGWHAKQWTQWTKVHHFKWHSAVLDNLHFRMVRDSGNCILGINEHECQPKFQFWKEVARQFQVLNASRSINITDLNCQEDVETLWNM